MKQINLQTSKELERDIGDYMKLKGIAHKSEAIRQAVKESVERLRQARIATDFYSWIGLALSPAPPSRPSQKDEDELWE